MMRDLVHKDEKGGFHFGSDLSSAARARMKLCEKDQLKELNLKEVRMPRVPMRITEYTWVTDLNLSKNNIKELGDKVINSLGHIQNLDISFNEIKELPDSLNSLGALHTLDVSANALHNFSSNLKFNRLRTLSVAKNLLKDFPSSFTSSLTSLDISSNSMNSVPSSIFNHSLLKYLDLSSNKLTNFPPQIERLTGLETLLMGNNQLTSGTVASLGVLVNLKVLNLSENKLDNLPPVFYQLVKLEKLYLQVNLLPNLSDEIGNLVNLEELYIARNQIAVIPETIGKLKKLRFIIANDNKVKILPHEFGHLYETLRKINFDNNQIQSLPGEFGWINPGIEFSFANNPLKSPFIQWYQEGPLQLLNNLSPYLEAWPSTSYAEGENLSSGTIRTGNSFLIKAFDMRGKPRVNGGDPFRVLAKMGEMEESLIVKDNKDGTYTVFYNLTEPGTWQVHVLFKGQETKGSPFTLQLR
eukprot:TRINITY_DN90_c1_g1_i1.p1 TRINITY_DN90_c1_g1~~TRINITY_DN90_c1_g1_i1.p1  ORF type:complete len:469 (+),score=203.37 TRINITY_DN90_c1_g1_i1:208-1614(+)